MKLDSPYANQYLDLKPEDYSQLIELAIKEDQTHNDVTSNTIFPYSENNMASAYIFTKEKAIQCGSPLVKYIASKFNSIIIEELTQDGQNILPQQKCFQIQGNINEILKFERISLNFLSYLSGISTLTNQVSKKLKKYNVKLLDTRKTLPGYRMLSKYAVAVGGGFNHRTNLKQMGMIKDNHIVKAGSIKQAISTFKTENNDIPLEVEIDSISQLDEALTPMVNCILLDNMNNQEMKDCTKQINKYNNENQASILIEASGNFNINNLDKLENTNVNYVSMSSITTAAKPIDFSLVIDNSNTLFT